MANPFASARTSLTEQIFATSGAFGRQGGGFNASVGRFDPNLEEAFRNRAFGQGVNALSSGLANLSGQEAGFLENQRQFDLNFGLQQDIFNAEKKAGEPNFSDYLGGAGSLALGVGSLFMGNPLGAVAGFSGAYNSFGGGSFGRSQPALEGYGSNSGFDPSLGFKPYR